MLSFMYWIIFGGNIFTYPIIFTIFGTLIVTSFMCLQCLFRPQGTSPHLVYKNSALAKYVLKKCPRLCKPIDVPFYLRNGHIQTFLPSLLPKVYYEFNREYLELKDGGAIALDWGVKPHVKLKKTSTILLLLPGLTSGAEGFTFLCHRAAQKGFRCVVFNRRGHGNSPLTTPKLQSFGDPSDLRQVIKYIRNIYNGARIVAVGNCAGSSLLVSYLGEYGSSSYLTTGVCISPAYEAEYFFNNGISKLYEWIFMWNLKYIISAHAEALSKVIDIGQVFQANRLVDLENRLYCNMYRYDNMSQYWERNCPMRDIDEIAIPVLCVNSYDDPVCKKERIPFDLFKVCPNFMLAATEVGGHGGFLHGPRLESWADKVALDYIIAVLDFMRKYDK